MKTIFPSRYVVEQEIKFLELHHAHCIGKSISYKVISDAIFLEKQSFTLKCECGFSVYETPNLGEYDLMGASIRAVRHWKNLIPKFEILKGNDQYNSVLE